MNTLTTEKEAQLKALLGPKLAEQVIEKAQQIEKQADDLGIAFKDDSQATNPETGATQKADAQPPAAPTKMGDMEPDKFSEMIAGAVTKALEPMHKAMQDIGKQYSKKDDETVTLKEAQSAQAKQLEDLAIQLKTQKEAYEKTEKDLKAQLDTFTGDLPPALADLHGFHPTQSEQNLTNKENHETPASDPLGEFFKFASPYAVTPQL